jgi:hypothetical protein
MFRGIVRKLCRCSIPTRSLFIIVIAYFLQCCTNTTTQQIIDLFNKFRLRLAYRQSQLGTARGIIVTDTDKQWKLNRAREKGERLCYRPCWVWAGLSLAFFAQSEKRKPRFTEVYLSVKIDFCINLRLWPSLRNATDNWHISMNAPFQVIKCPTPYNCLSVCLSVRPFIGHLSV